MSSSTLAGLILPTAADALEAFGDDKIAILINNYRLLLGYLGCDTDNVPREWSRLKGKIARDANLRSMPYSTLWERMFDQAVLILPRLLAPCSLVHLLCSSHAHCEFA